MKRLIFLVSLLTMMMISSSSHGQTENIIYGKQVTVKTRDTSSAELKIVNSTRNVPGYLKNIGGGLTRFTLPDYSELINKPTTFPPSSHTHGNADITDLAWSKLTGVPDLVLLTRFIDSLVSVQGRINSKLNITDAASTYITIARTLDSLVAVQARIQSKLAITNYDWSTLPSKPSTFTPSAHTHPYSDLTGTVPTWNQNTTGNAATATLATNVDVLSAASGLAGIALAPSLAPGSQRIYYNSSFTYNSATTTLNVPVVSASNIYLSSFFYPKDISLAKGLSFINGGAPSVIANSTAFYINRSGTTTDIVVRTDTSVSPFTLANTLRFNNAGSYTYTFPALTGTVALTSNLSAYLLLTGGALTGALNGTTASFSGNGNFGSQALQSWWSLFRVLQVGTGSSVVAGNQSTTSDISLYSNTYYDGTNYKILNSASFVPSFFTLDDGTLNLYVGNAGSIGSNVTGITSKFSVSKTGAVSGTTISMSGNGTFTGATGNDVKITVKSNGSAAPYFRADQSLVSYGGFAFDYNATNYFHIGSLNGNITNRLSFYGPSAVELMALTTSGLLLVGNPVNDGSSIIQANGVIKAISGANPSIFNTLSGVGIAIENSNASNKRWRLSVTNDGFALTEAGVADWLTVRNTSGQVVINSSAAHSIIGGALTYPRWNYTVGAKTWSAGFNANTLSYEIQDNSVVKFSIDGDGYNRMPIGLITQGVHGKAYYATGVGSAGTSIVDTDIFYAANGNTAGYDKVSVYQVVVTGNPNVGGSGSYQSTVTGILTISTGYDGANVSQFVNFAQTSNVANGISALTVSAVFWNGSSEYTDVNDGTTNTLIRLKISGYASGIEGVNQTVRITKIL